MRRKHSCRLAWTAFLSLARRLSGVRAATACAHATEAALAGCGRCVRVCSACGRAKGGKKGRSLAGELNRECGGDHDLFTGVRRCLNFDSVRPRTPAKLRRRGRAALACQPPFTAEERVADLPAGWPTIPSAN